LRDCYGRRSADGQPGGLRLLCYQVHPGGSGAHVGDTSGGAQLYAPLRALIYIDSGDRTRFAVDQPSTVMAGFADPAIAELGADLDHQRAELLKALSVGAAMASEVTASGSRSGRQSGRVALPRSGLGASRPRARARATASARVCVPSLSYRWRMWVRTVLCETYSSPPICDADRLVGR
jgi:hypothetical protein